METSSNSKENPVLTVIFILLLSMNIAMVPACLTKALYTETPVAYQVSKEYTVPPRPDTPDSLPPHVSQGDKYKIVTERTETVQRFSNCVISYIDSHRRAWTAAHCGREGAAAVTPNGKLLGIMRHVHDYDHEESGYDPDLDLAYIQLYGDVVVGKNSFSDKGSNMLNSGGRLCAFSSENDYVTCGNISNVRSEHDVTVQARGVHVVKGDSGGPAWVEGKDIVGVISGYTGEGIAIISLVNPEDLESVGTRSLAKN